MTDELVARIKKLLPVSWDNELDGHGEPTHANLTFGEHSTQAMTLCPDDWMALNDVPDTIANLQQQVKMLEEALRRADEAMTCRREDNAHYCPNCDNSLYDARDAIRAALQSSTTGKESPRPVIIEEGE